MNVSQKTTSTHVARVTETCAALGASVITDVATPPATPPAIAYDSQA
ncbi:hypothetical protein ACWD7F_13495 [Streptomyces sp. NPDC005122]